jgi:hypothetical protein
MAGPSGVGGAAEALLRACAEARAIVLAPELRPGRAVGGAKSPRR